jgi:cytochrome P450
MAALYEIGLHPEWQSRLRADMGHFPENEYLHTARLSKVDSLPAVLKEALRLHPPFPGPFERVIAPGSEAALTNVKLLPAGMRIWSSLFVMCRSERVFGKEAHEFRPERWLDSEPEKLKGMDDLFGAFGSGSRVCIGQDLAWMVLQKLVAAVSDSTIAEYRMVN